MKIKHFVLIALLSVISLFLIIMAAKSIMLLMPISKNKMQEEFTEQKEILLDIATYFQKQSYSSIYITSHYEKAKIYVENNEGMRKYVYITDDTIVEDLTDLFKKYHYSLVVKNNNGIYFQRYSNRDYGRGVVYSIDGQQPQNELLTQLEPLNEESWYFYEEK